ncbi:helix-turn-helix transcriptional regulator [Tistrella mobilis]
MDPKNPPDLQMDASSSEEVQVGPSSRANRIDVHVGKRILRLRQLRGISQHQLGNALNLTFQQIQKYERGLNRISSGRLYIAAKFLGVPVSYFFEGLPTGDKCDVWLETDQYIGSAVAQSKNVLADINDHEFQELLAAYIRISDPTRRRALAAAVQNIADLYEGITPRAEGDAPLRTPPRRRRGRPPKKRD